MGGRGLHHEILDNRWSDALNPPTLHDPEIDLYKEWHHFVFFEPLKNVFALANTAILGNPYDAQKGVTVLTLLLNYEKKWWGSVETRGMETVTFSNGNPDISGPNLSLSCKKNTYHLSIQSFRKPITLNLSAIPEIGYRTGFYVIPEKGHLQWIFYPRLTASGMIKVNGKQFSFKRVPAFHDHNWGRFSWGEMLAWDWGVFLELNQESPHTMLYYRLFRPGYEEEADTSIFVFRGRSLQDRLFPPQLLAENNGGFTGEVWKIPGLMAALHPCTLPAIPAEVQIVARTTNGLLGIRFSSEQAAQIIVPNRKGEGESILSQCLGEVNVRLGTLSESETRFIGYMEFSRPTSWT